MKIERYVIAGGNSTLLVEGSPLVKRDAISQKGLQVAEQVGFVSRDQELPYLCMMGEELSVNGTIAFAKTLVASGGSLRTSGFNGIVGFTNLGELTSITMELPYRQEGNIILFEGIGYQCVKNMQVPSANELRYMSRKYSLPAFGTAIFNGNRLSPYVYVEKTNSLVAETACGSASIALNILTGQKRIVQPTGQAIYIARTGNQFTIAAKVAKIRNGIRL